MAEITAAASELTSQYSAQVIGDLERNLKEQERVSGEIAALQEQLAALQQDHEVLTKVRQALGIAPEAEKSEAEKPAAEKPAAAVVPAARRSTSKASKAAKETKSDQAPTANRKRVGRKAPAKATAAPAAAPTLVDLVRAHLAARQEPRSAAEIADTLGREHPERTLKTTVVRTALEGLVAKDGARRHKQGKSVFYTASDVPAPTAVPEDNAQ
ncbi:hypothetical protein [Streptomyces sp. NPDC048002]|uniref:hypothetical protein n=1 Tax=Streptomyces sp. NPDC048002 TaxID=3154344 RepID=UPI0033FC6309